jgi:hypothetical protein
MQLPSVFQVSANPAQAPCLGSAQNHKDEEVGIGVEEWLSLWTLFERLLYLTREGSAGCSSRIIAYWSSEDEGGGFFIFPH